MMMTIDEVAAALRRLRVPKIIDEYKLQSMVADVLREAGLPAEKEYRLGPRSRIDFLVEGGIGVEVKKGKPPKLAVIAQIERYAACHQITGIILIVEQLIHDVPKEISGKPCLLIALNKLWGIAL
ncbi:hypothetical protein [Anaeroselena agilis]|uniref:Type I restriction enzyme R protein N-terminal domain-containing protein n=1 Tax=Anaeroselena agilis TaxID=3063788 RepID=A0ABU3NY18_9FIRM|nr:hypothetical protein [Selenomonadales bacterium 4137-cl]MDT8901864.1 hypothetical protein [Selenomonadales bacterium 4137-cl]